MSMIEEILREATVTEPERQITSNHLPDNRASLTFSLLRLRYLLYDMAIDLGMSEQYSREEISNALWREIFLDEVDIFSR